MATHSFDTNDIMNFRSANQYRNALNNRDTPLREQLADVIDPDLKALANKLGDNAYRLKTRAKIELEKDLRKDVVSNELLETRDIMRAASGIVTGAALMLASFATEAAYERRMREAEDMANHAMTQGYDAANERKLKQCEPATKQMMAAIQKANVQNEKDVQRIKKDDSIIDKTAAIKQANETRDEAIKNAIAIEKKKNAPFREEFNKTVASLKPLGGAKLAGGCASIADVKKLHFKVGTGERGDQFVRNVFKTHYDLGQDLAYRFGTEQEVELLKRYAADIDALEAAKKTNTQYTPITTQREREEVQAIVKKYAGLISSTSEIKKTIANYAVAIIEIKAESAELRKQLADAQNLLRGVNKQIAKCEQAIEQRQKYEKILKTGINKDGSKLTQEQREKLEKKLQSMPSIKESASRLSKLMAQQNTLTNTVEKTKEKLAKNDKTISGLTNQSQLLEKHGKTILDTYETQLNDKEYDRGGSKRAKQLGAKASKAFRQSYHTIARKMSRELHAGNDIHKELKDIKGGVRKLDSAGRAYDMALHVTHMGLKVITNPMGRAIKHIGKNTQIGTRLMEKFGKFKPVGKVFGKAMKLPSTILKTPYAIINFPKKAASKALKGARRRAARAVGAGSRLVRKGMRAGARVVGKAVRNTKVYKKLQNKLAPWHKRAQKIKNALGVPFKPFKKASQAVKKGVGKLISLIMGAISTVFSAVLTVLGYVLLAAIALILIVVIVMLLTSALASVLNAIMNWFTEHDAQQQSYVKHNPEFIISQAVNYRDAELELLDMFYQAQSDIYASDSSNVTIPVNNDPVYHAFCGYGKSAVELSRTNNSSYNQFLSRYPNVELDWTQQALFASSLQHYDSVKVSYYTTDALKTGSNGSYLTETVNGVTQYILKDGAVPSDYEISNAKDALALVDSIYTTRYNTMQYTEVLAYLGVGETQLAKSDGEINNSLFWASHKIIYLQGTEVSDIDFHNTNSYGYVGDGCDNYTTMDFQVITTDEETGEQLVTIESHQICRGHIELEVAIVVSLIEDGSLFDDAMRVDGLEEDTYEISLVQVSEVNGNWVWGGTLYHAYHPYEDWAPNSELTDLAMVKFGANFTYYVDEDSENSINISLVSHNYSSNKSNARAFVAFKKSEDGLFLFGMFFNGRVYYVESFVSGEQKDIVCHDGGQIKIVSFVVDSGVPIPPQS